MQYLSDDNHTLDLSDIIPNKRLLISNFYGFTKELNNYLSTKPTITQLTLRPSLLKEIIGLDTNYLPFTETAYNPQATDSTGHVITPLAKGNISKLNIKTDRL